MASTLITVWITTIVVCVAFFSVLLLLRAAPSSVHDRFRGVLARWNKTPMELVDRDAYPWAVVMVVFIGLMLIGAVASIFVPR